MNAWKHVRQLSLATVYLLTMTQCSNEESRSDKVLLKVSPDRPVVFTADYETTTGSLAAPWFMFTMALANNADKKLQIVGVELEVTRVGSNDPPQVYAISPSAFDGIPELTDGSCTYTTFGTWDPGDAKPFTLSDTASSALCVIDNPWLAVSGLPEELGSDRVSRYRVKVKPMGFFLDTQTSGSTTYEIPGFRFTKYQVISTQ